MNKFFVFISDNFLAVLAASIFHFSEFSIKEAKEAMKASGITVRF